jgi:cellulose synthase operon protein C
LRQAAAQAGSDPRILYHYAVALNDTGQKDQAVKLLNTVVANKAQFTEKADAQKLLDQLGKT